MLVETDLNSGEVSWNMLKIKVVTSEEGSQGYHPQFFPITTYKFNVMGENQEVELR